MNCRRIRSRALFSQFGLDVLLAESVNQMLDGSAGREKRTAQAVSLADQASMVAVLENRTGRGRGLLSTVAVTGLGDDASRGTLAQQERCAHW